jgi:hypothetical protein
VFKKIFNKADLPPPAVKPAPKPRGPKPASAEVTTEWRGKLEQAMGDDNALFTVARDAPLLSVKEAAVDAITGEETLKLAEREFRSHDRRVHRLAKQRYERVVARRETQVLAGALVESATALLSEPNIPANRLVELDRDWLALDRTLIEADLAARYDACWAELTTLTRGRGDRQLMLSRWTLDAEQTLRRATRTSAEVQSGGAPSDRLVSAATDLQRILSTVPEGETPSLLEDVQAALVKLADLGATLARETAQREQAERADSTRQEAKAAQKAANTARVAAIEEQVVAAEASLAAGQLADTGKHLSAIDTALEKEKNLPAALNKRIEAVQSEYARLRGWQHWAGGQARDELVLEAEALAARVADAEKAAKLPIKPHADAIEQMRTRWKELDKLGGATSRALWLRFDTALKAAYVPVAANVAKLKAAREQNLAARNQLVTALDAVILPGADEATPDWRDAARAVDHFQVEWRKLGPLEHTVPHKSRDALVKRMNASVARIETPLQEVRRVAQLKREALITQAKALAADTHLRDGVTKVRDLQSEWQRQAKALPLMRNIENALWNEFKTATDAIFKQRDAAMSAREAEWKTNRDAREVLIGRLRALTADSAPAEIKRTLQEVDSAWRRAGEVARKDSAAIEQRFRTARDAAQKWSAGSATRAWNVIVDALVTKMLLCEEAEAGADSTEIDTRWEAVAKLPAEWESALAQRRRQPAPIEATALDAVLLQLESTLDIESPAPFQAARRALKLVAMKQALEARQTATTTDADIRRMVGEMIGQRCEEAMPRTRCQAIIDALRQRPLAR